MYRYFLAFFVLCSSLVFGQTNDTDGMPSDPRIKIRTQTLVLSGSAEFTLQCPTGFAEVWVDFALAGRTAKVRDDSLLASFTTHLDAGLHRIELRSPQSAAISADFLLQENTQYLTLWTPDRLVGKADIAVEPSDAALLIDGENAWPGIIALAPGVHKISVKAFGYATRDLNVDIRPNETMALKVSLEPARFQVFDFSVIPAYFYPGKIKMGGGPDEESTEAPKDIENTKGWLEIGVNVSAPALGSVEIISASGMSQATLAFPREAMPRLKVYWDGRTRDGLPVEVGKYTAVATIVSAADAAQLPAPPGTMAKEAASPGSASPAAAAAASAADSSAADKSASGSDSAAATPDHSLQGEHSAPMTLGNPTVLKKIFYIVSADYGHNLSITRGQRGLVWFPNPSPIPSGAMQTDFFWAEPLLEGKWRNLSLETAFGLSSRWNLGFSATLDSSTLPSADSGADVNSYVSWSFTDLDQSALDAALIFRGTYSGNVAAAFLSQSTGFGVLLPASVRLPLLGGIFRCGLGAEASYFFSDNGFRLGALAGAWHEDPNFSYGISFRAAFRVIPKPDLDWPLGIALEGRYQFYPSPFAVNSRILVGVQKSGRPSLGFSLGLGFML